MIGKILARMVAKLKRISNTVFPSRTIAKNTRPLLLHREKHLSAFPATTPDHLKQIGSDAELVKRIISAYQIVNKSDLGDSMWKTFFSSYHNSIHQTLMAGDIETVAKIFRDPRTSDLFYGFDILCKSFYAAFKSKQMRGLHAKVCLDGLVRFAEATGAIRIDNPETWPTHVGEAWETEEVLTQLSKKCWPFSVPNPFPGEHGLETSRGIISYRTPQALYQAWCVKKLVSGIENPRILEIGAGLGRTAYYAYELGLKDYSIVDIPITAAAQAYFLGRTIGEENIQLEGEQTDGVSEGIKILMPQTFLNGQEKYDLIINVDSLTEMDFSTAKEYWGKIKSSSDMFFSINHEVNSFCVKDLIESDLPSYAVNRYPSWMRRGYVEELVVKKASP